MLALRILYLTICLSLWAMPSWSAAIVAPNLVPTDQMHVLVIDYYSMASSADREVFIDQVNSYLSTYIERCVEIVNDAVQLKKSKKDTMRDINAIVVGALGFYEYQQLQNFDGFSAMVEDKLVAIDKIDFRKAKQTSGGSVDATIRSIQEYYLKKELEDLKLLINIELGMFSGQNLMVKTSTEKTLVDENTKRELLAQYTGSNKNTPLGPIRVKISDESVALINFKDTSSLDTSPPASNQDSELMHKVLQLLEQNTNKLDQMQMQIDQMRLEQIKHWQEQQDEKNIALQSQIDELKRLILTGQVPTTSANGTTPSSNTVLNFPSQVELFYKTGETNLDASSQLALNEIVDLLARQPHVKVVISGYADKSGDPATNVLISSKRAKAVKDFFVKSGLESERFITTYFGDTDTSYSGNNRRVMVKFIQP